ncbi:MAG: DUF2442 domain-containing protein [Hungatella sp.]|jgi:hypothetical protein|nr:DUF2442 domain-containing protein [Hungatella sp.]
MSYRIKEVYPLPDYTLLVSFTTGDHRQYDVAPLFDKWDAFKTLSSVEGLFDQVRVDAGGYGVSWNDDIDLSCNELWENGTPVEVITFDDLLRDEIANAEIIAEVKELEKTLAAEKDQHFTGPTADFPEELFKEE